MSAPKSIVKSTSVRDFSGGWNVIDNEVNLNPKYAVKTENMVRAADGSLEVRPGYRFFADVREGIEGSGSASGVSMTFYNEDRTILVSWTGHGLLSQNHITFAGLGTLHGIDMDTTFGIASLSVNSFYIVARTAATSSGTSAGLAFNYTYDDHKLYADVIDGVYHDNALILVDRLGEIVSVSAEGNATRIWDTTNALNIGVIPWGRCSQVYFKTAKGKLYACNYVDKPIEIDLDATPKVTYLVDPSDNSNDTVPIARLMETVGGYLVMVGYDHLGTPIESTLQFSAKNAIGVYEGNANPDDAINIDLALITQTASARITGLGIIRNKLFAAFRDNSMLGNVGDYLEGIHTPRFDDNIPQHGTAAPRSVVCLGNDILMCDFAGVPSISISYASGQHTPERISELIAPPMLRNLSRLSTTTIERKVFAVWSPIDRRYMLFMPKYEESSYLDAGFNAFTVPDELVGTPYALMYIRNHLLDEGDYLELVGMDGFAGLNPSDVNGNRLIAAIVDENYIMVELGDNSTEATDPTGGGVAGSYLPINDETPCYVFAFNPKLRVKAWSRFRGLQFDWGCVSLQGKLFFGKGGKVYQFGTTAVPVHADKAEEFDESWEGTGETYAVGDRVFDNEASEGGIDPIIYECLIAHTADAGTFQDWRAAHPEYWQRYFGYPIEFDYEMPWADFDKRSDVKKIRHIGFDTKGYAPFTVEAYVDNIYRDELDLQRAPTASMVFEGSDAGGYGLPAGLYGAGRRTKEEFIWNYGVMCKLLKLRFTGSVIAPLKLISINLNYLVGGIQR